MRKFNLRLDRKVVGLFILVVGTYFAFTHNVKTAYAAVNPSGLSAQYGCMLNRNSNGFGAYNQGGSEIGTNMIIYMDYSNNSSKVLVTMTNNFNTQNVTSSSSKVTTTFSEAAVVGLTATYKMVHTITNSDGSAGGTANFIGIVVNSGNTILLTQAEENQSKATWSGVCQKI